MAVPGSPEPGSRRIIDMAPIRVETESTTRFRTTKNRKNPQDQQCPIWGEKKKRDLQEKWNICGENW